VDVGQELLACQRSTAKYVLFGESSGLLTLTERVSQTPISYDKIKVMSMERLQVLFNTS
jgi:hypothetical protein